MHITIQNFGFNNAVKCFTADGFYEFSTRIHQFTEIQYIIEGSLDLVVDGKAEHLEAGDIAVISPFRAHSFKASADAKRWILIPSNNFIIDFISSESALIKGERCSFRASEGLSAYIKESLFDMGDRIIDLDEDKKLMLRIKALAYPILEEYMRKVPQSKSEIKNTALAAIIMYLRDHFTENVTRSSVSEALGYSPSYISHVIECIPDMNFSSLLNSLRVERAKELLKNKSFGMIDIALECGFGSERSFYRVFKDATGMSPKKYIKLNKSSQLENSTS